MNGVGLSTYSCKRSKETTVANAHEMEMKSVEIHIEKSCVKSPDIDSGWAYVVAFAAWMSSTISSGI